MKGLVFSLFLIFPLLLQADMSRGQRSCSKSAKGVLKCLGQVLPLVKNIGNPAAENCSQSPKSNECTPSAENINEGCGKFMSEKNTDCIGPWGKKVQAYLQEKGSESLFFKKDLSSACSNWKSLNTKQKEKVWVWIVTLIANKESTCMPRNRNKKATNGVAVGLLMLDERLSARKWRGPNCNKRDILDITTNIRCGLDILEELLLGKEGEYQGNGELWGPRSNSYWEELRKKGGGDIADLIQDHPLCRF
jgi:hypothetical protein